GCHFVYLWFLKPSLGFYTFISSSVSLTLRVPFNLFFMTAEPFRTGVMAAILVNAPLSAGSQAMVYRLPMSPSMQDQSASRLLNTFAVKPFPVICFRSR